MEKGAVAPSQVDVAPEPAPAPRAAAERRQITAMSYLRTDWPLRASQRRRS
jgi:hypothetical protein